MKNLHIDDILECLCDLTDEFRIRNDLNFDNTIDYFYGIESSISLWKSDIVVLDIPYKGMPYISTMRLLETCRFKERGLKVYKNIIAFNISYSPGVISDNSVKSLLMSCKERLNIYDCQLYFMMKWIEEKQSDYEKLLVNKLDNGASRNITIRIESPSNFMY